MQMNIIVFSSTAILLPFLICNSLTRAYNLACGIPNKARVPCNLGFTNRAHCNMKGCCWDELTCEKSLKCYKKIKLLQMSFHPSPQPTINLPFTKRYKKTVLNFGGTSSGHRTSVERRCSFNRNRRTCGSPYKTNRYACLRMGCCWLKYKCYQAVYSVIRIEKKCPAGFRNSFFCSENQVNYCKSDPCPTGETCLNLENGYKCKCTKHPSGICTSETFCPPPPSIMNGFYSNLKKSTYRLFESAVYECNPGYVLYGPSLNMCKEGGKWSKSGMNLPECLPGKDEDLDIVIILDSSMDNCLSNFPATITGHHFGLGNFLTPITFPNFFQQIRFVLGFESSWNTVSLTDTRVALHLNAGTCEESFGSFRHLDQTGITDADVLLSQITSYCFEPNFIETIRCASEYHFNYSKGDRAGFSNVIILVVPDVTNLHFNALGVIEKVNKLKEELNIKLFTVTATNSKKINPVKFVDNIDFLSELACGLWAPPGCGVLGTIYDPPNLLTSQLRSALKRI